jgi:hypothetical protein
MDTKQLLAKIQLYVNMGQANHVFNCDVCRKRISGARQHCLDCFNFDMCAIHSPADHNATHRFKTYGNAASPSPAQPKVAIDPFLDEIFGAPKPKSTDAKPSAPLEEKANDQLTDMTLVIARRRVERFLLCLVNWLEIWERTGMQFGNSGLKVSEIPRSADDKEAISQLIGRLNIWS